MNTYKIDKKEIEGMNITETGYKVLHYDLKGNYGDFRYGDVDENICGNIYKVDGDINLCNWGLHSSKDPANVFNFYEPLGYNRYFKVNSYGDILHNDEKTVASVIEFVDEYNLMEFLEIIKEYPRSNGVSWSNGISNSNGVSESYGVSWSNGISNSNGVSRSDGVSESNGVSWSNGISNSNGVSRSYGVSESNGINWSYGVSESYGVSRSYGVSWSNGISNSNGVSESYGVSGCKSIKQCIFCYDIECVKHHIFNKQVSQNRFEEVYNAIMNYQFVPYYTNIYDLKGNLEWYRVNLPLLFEYDKKQAWSKMPREMIDYIIGLQEFDKDIFYDITGIKVE